MNSFAKYLLTVLTIVAVGGSQIWGVVTGYLCQCHGSPVETEQASVCWTVNCHHEQMPSGDGNDTPLQQHEHEPVTEALVSNATGPVTLDVPPPASVDLPEGIAPGILLASELAEHRAELAPPDDTGPAASAGLVVARTVVMLV